MTRAELTKLAVAALGEGARVYQHKDRGTYYTTAEYRPGMRPRVTVDCNDKAAAMRALAAALQAIVDSRGSGGKVD